MAIMKEEPRLRLGLDLDGCLYDCVTEFKYTIFGTTSGIPEPHSWSVWDHWNISRDDFQKKFDNEVKNGYFFSRGKPYKDSLEVVNNLAEKHEINIVTDRARWPEALTQTSNWLNKYDVPYSSLVFASDKTVANVDVLVDDRPDNCIEFCKNGPGFAILLARPWNWDYQNDDYDFIVARNWLEIEEIIG